jgi:hypothetical protein
MSALEVERTLARLYTDCDYRRAFLADPHRALDPFELTAQEKADLAAMDRAGLVMAAASYQHKRIARTAARCRPDSWVSKRMGRIIQWLAPLLAAISLRRRV